jgi:hypothetical protein
MGDKNSTEQMPEGDASIICDPKVGLHAFKPIFKCDRANCETFLCKKCMGGVKDHQRFCIVCMANEENKEMDFDTPLGEGVGAAQGFKSSFSVKADKDSGKVVGWEDFFQHIDDVSKDMEKEINKYKKQKEDVIITY